MITLTELYACQEEVDQFISNNLDINIHDVEHVDKRVTAFHVELGELANEIGFFKYWKTSHFMDKAKTIEELADCIAFILSVGISRKYTFIKEINPMEWKRVPLGQLFRYLFRSELHSAGDWKQAFEQLICIGLKLGFSSGEILAAYYLKSNTNIERQKQNY
jgi:dimeric dUTPase (all-alpha-NTP-PPase superfamily)